ncbi:MAG: Asp-tRNA(Asn)/Glu-tRNA(Gln) amidotransferase subunit GatC [Methyloligellaceae bacterium]
MKVDEKTVRHIARLARLQVTDEEAKNLETELSSIMNWIEQLNEVDTDDVQPLTSIVEVSLKQRDDVVTDGGYPEEIMKNAPLSEDHFFMVPKVVE